MVSQIYLDNNATTRPLPEVREAILEALGVGFGNPSSAHSVGDRSREHVRRAREVVADLIGADRSQLVFTSGGTESNNMVLASAVMKSRKDPCVITTTVEHSSMLNMCEYLESQGVHVVYLDVDRKGNLDLKELESSISPNTVLVSIQWVNSETGVIQPIEAIGAICLARNVPFHTDAAQAVGKLQVELSKLPIDFASFTGHKFHGPQGVGALYARRPKALHPMFFGGQQENGLRAGTENVPGIMGLGKAAELRFRRLKELLEGLGSTRDHFERFLLSKVPNASVNGDPQNRICNTTNILFSGIDGQALVARLDQEGIQCSQSSACTNQRPEPSYVLRAMGLSEADAYSSVRFSVSQENSIEEVQMAAAKIVAQCEQLRKFSAARSHTAS